MSAAVNVTNDEARHILTISSLDVCISHILSALTALCADDVLIGPKASCVNTLSNMLSGNMSKSVIDLPMGLRDLPSTLALLEYFEGNRVRASLHNGGWCNLINCNTKAAAQKGVYFASYCS